MTKEELDDLIKTTHPEMLSHEDFMHNMESLCCKDKEHKDFRKLTDKIDRQVFEELEEKIFTANVGQLIDYLKDNFKPTDKLCYMDCVEGMKNNCTYVTKDQLGERFFYYVKDLKQRNIKKFGSSKKDEDKLFPYVDDCDIIMI